MAGVFKATRQGIFFYDYSKENYISSNAAEDVIEGKLPKPTTGFYDAEMPLLYPIEVTKESTAGLGMCQFIGERARGRQMKPSIWRVSPSSTLATLTKLL